MIWNSYFVQKYFIAIKVTETGTFNSNMSTEVGGEASGKMKI